MRGEVWWELLVRRADDTQRQRTRTNLTRLAEHVPEIDSKILLGQDSSNPQGLKIKTQKIIFKKKLLTFYHTKRYNTKYQSSLNEQNMGVITELRNYERMTWIILIQLQVQMP